MLFVKINLNVEVAIIIVSNTILSHDRINDFTVNAHESRYCPIRQRAAPEFRPRVI